MRSLKSILFIAGFLASSLVFANDKVEAGRQLFEQNCAVCHGGTGGMNMSKRLAPPMMGVRMHYIKKYPDKESFVGAIVSWVEKPEKDKSLIKMAVRKFGLMPLIPVTQDDVENIAEYIFEGKLDRPEGFDEHVKKMHGGKGHKHGGEGHDHSDGKKGDCGGMKH
ncbi:MAG: hypothetical protein A6F70_00505 [Cycloclasticus sp. symbiont of Bathymodiolus heckerae]|nr:MAG: hypothetical protein A6F70_00505 [Cycloclasticus sp. symbiont of Bathymodiolus heckerae]